MIHVNPYIITQFYYPLKYKQIVGPYIGKWNTAYNETGENSLRQHYYIDFERTEQYTGKKYMGNRALCSSGGLSNDGNEFLSLDQIEEEAPRADRCGRCKRLIEQREQKIKQQSRLGETIH